MTKAGLLKTLPVQSDDSRWTVSVPSQSDPLPGRTPSKALLAALDAVETMKKKVKSR